jgi:signal transduction histidine kinase
MRKQSLKRLLLAYAVGYLALVLAAGAAGGVGMYFLREASKESTRINTIVNEVQDMRGNLYRQVKEVFDGAFLNDPYATEQYQQYERRIVQHFARIKGAPLNARERDAINRLEAAYRSVKEQADGILESRSTMSLRQRQKIFDAELEGSGLGEYEDAFRAIERVLLLQQSEQQERLGTLTRLAPLLFVVPVALALALLVLSRVFLSRQVVAPLSDLESATRKIASGELAHRVPEAGAEELQRLAQAVNRMALDLEESRASLVRAEKQATLGALLPVVAHNIRNPLASIRATAQIMSAPPISHDLRDGLSGIISTADKLDRWTQSLLNYLHPLAPQRAPCKLSALVDNVLDMLKPKLAGKQLTLDRMGWEEDVEINADPHLIEQALQGLLSNAIEASPVDGSLTLRVEGHADFALLSIRDEGAGIPFSPTAKDLAPGPSTKRFGTGLGIPFAMKVCDVHGGSIAFDNLLPRGTEVRITLPRF